MEGARRLRASITAPQGAAAASPGSVQGQSHPWTATCPGPPGRCRLPRATQMVAGMRQPPWGWHRPVPPQRCRGWGLWASAVLRALGLRLGAPREEGTEPTDSAGFHGTRHGGGPQKASLTEAGAAGGTQWGSGTSSPSSVPPLPYAFRERQPSGERIEPHRCTPRGGGLQLTRS